VAEFEKEYKSLGLEDYYEEVAKKACEIHSRIMESGHGAVVGIHDPKQIVELAKPYAGGDCQCCSRRGAKPCPPARVGLQLFGRTASLHGKSFSVCTDCYCKRKTWGAAVCSLCKSYEMIACRIGYGAYSQGVDQSGFLAINVQEDKPGVDKICFECMSKNSVDQLMAKLKGLRDEKKKSAAMRCMEHLAKMSAKEVEELLSGGYSAKDLSKHSSSEVDVAKSFNHLREMADGLDGVAGIKRQREETVQNDDD